MIGKGNAGGLDEIDYLITEANQHLKSTRTRLSIHRDGESLLLRGIFPPKPQSGKLSAYKQRLYLNLPTTASGVRLAESKAIEIRELIDSDHFDWNQFLSPKSEVKPSFNIGFWVLSLEQDYFNRRERTPKSQLTWDKDYLASFKKLDWDKPLSCDYLEKIIITSPPDSRVRKRLCCYFGVLAKHAGLGCDFSRLTGKYSIKSSEARNIPSDRQIMEAWKLITNPSWRWVYGVMATYGLRNHEVFRLDLSAFGKRPQIVTVQEGKTGYRRVWAIYPEWIDYFGLTKVSLPNVDLKRSNHSLGTGITRAFHRAGIDFHPYDLRHAWAIRTLVYGIDVGFAAQMMGHSLQVHTQLYHRWIQEHHYEQAFKLLMQRDNRPLPPNDSGTT
jgi:integrase